MQLGEFKNKAIQVITELKTEKPKDKKTTTNRKCGISDKGLMVDATFAKTQLLRGYLVS